MQKIKLISSLSIGVFASTLLATPVLASTGPSVVAIQSLPSYITSNNFKLSCTTDGTSAQFYYNKNGAGWTSFGSAIDTSANQCVVQVDSSVVNDQTSYEFKVNVDGTDSGTASTFYDVSGPSPVSGYYKERPSDGEYKLHWTNPGDSDFDKVVIYRGDAVDFSADSGHEIARVSGGSNSDMTYEDHFAPDAGKTYFYALRALDHAGNSSSLVGDGNTETTVVTTTPTPGPSGKVTVLPVQEGSGSVLGSETSMSPSPEASSTPEAMQAASSTTPFHWIATHKKISLGVALILAVLGYGIFSFTKRK